MCVFTLLTPGLVSLMTDDEVRQSHNYQSVSVFLHTWLYSDCEHATVITWPLLTKVTFMAKCLSVKYLHKHAGFISRMRVFVSYR